MAQNVADILGVALEFAQNLLEAAGGDEALAIELGLSGEAASSVPESGGDASFKPPFDHWSGVWADRTPLPAAWSEQRLDVTTPEGGIIQQKNGPCGVLAVLQAEIWSQHDVNLSLEDKLTRAVADVLGRIASHNGRKDVSFPDGSTKPIDEAALSIRTARELVEVAATTAGPHTLRAGQSLVEGPHWLCSADLLSLLIRGIVGNGNFGAWDSTTKEKIPFFSSDRPKFGLLSVSEVEEGIKVADDLKFPPARIWVTHTGDHFTTMRLLKESPEEVLLEVFNGLPPAGPSSSFWLLTGDCGLAEPASPKFVETFKKKRPGQADDIVQARKGVSTDYKQWTFEVVPAVEDLTVEGPLDDDPDEPIYAFDSATDESTPWRCGSCYYTRFKTMCFGQNESGAKCSTCGKLRSEAFWSLWQTFEQLSPRMKRRARQMYAPKIELLISTVWPHATITTVTTPTQLTP